MRFPDPADGGAPEVSPLDARSTQRRGGRWPWPDRRWRVVPAVCAIALAVIAPLVGLAPTRALLIGLLPTPPPPTPPPPTPIPLHVLQPQATQFTSIDMRSPTEGWVVGYDSGMAIGEQQHPYLLRFHNGAWTVEPLPQVSFRPHTIAMVSATEGWIGGEGYDQNNDGYGVMLHVIGGHWTQYQLPASVGLVQSIAMLSPSEGWAVGSSSETGAGHGQILHYRQGQWAVELTTPDASQLLSISMVSATEGWAAGSSPSANVLWHYSNGSWQRVTPNDPKQADLEYVSMLSPDEGWGIGNYPLPAHTGDQYPRTAGALWRYSGGRWQVVARYHPNDLTQLAMLQAISPDEVWISERDGDGAHLVRYIAGAWQATPTPTGYAIFSFAMFNGRDGWAVGDASQIMHEVNGAWRAYPTP